MNKRSFVAALMVSAAMYTMPQSAMAQQNIQSIEIGAPIPMADAKMKSTDKKEVSLESKKTDKGLLVMFSCNTCPYVVKSEARTKEAMEYAAKKGIGMVIVNSNAAQRGEADSYDAMVKYGKKQGYKAPYVVDEESKLADAFGATRTPEVFLFDGSGKLVYKGAMEDNPSTPSESKSLYLKAAVDNMLSNKPIDPATTKSIGCTIKKNS
ncbi:MAG: thioredoxin family protein [Sphingobacteriales bacterium]|nr:MAG: thioredoxin family protein [Sphingobacteriales bacterium]